MARGARKQLAAALDEFWGRVYDKHGCFIQSMAQPGPGAPASASPPPPAPAPAPSAGGGGGGGGGGAARAAAVAGMGLGMGYSFGACWGSGGEAGGRAGGGASWSQHRYHPYLQPGRQHEQQQQEEEGEGVGEGPQPQQRSWPLSSPLQCQHTRGQLCCPWCSDLLLAEVQECLGGLAGLAGAGEVLFPAGGGASLQSNCGWAAGVLQQPAAVRHLHVVVALATGDGEQALAVCGAPDAALALLELAGAGRGGGGRGRGGARGGGAGVGGCLLRGRQELGPAAVLSLGLWSLLTLLQWCQVGGRPGGGGGGGRAP
jgi:hypothetical protein